MVLSNDPINTDKVSSVETEMKPVRLDDIEIQPEVGFKNGGGGVVALDDEIVAIGQAKSKENWFKRTFCCRGEKKKKNMIPFFKLFKFADKKDYIMMCVGIFGALGNGASLPLMIYIFTNMIGDFSTSARICPNTTTANVSQSEQVYGNLLENMKMQAIYMIALGFGTMILMYLQVTYWVIPAERQSRLIRKSLFVSILRQDIGWFDVNKSEELNNRLTEDVNKIKDGLGDKLGNGVQYVATFVIAVIISLVRGWKLTLVILSISPIIFISAVLFTQLTSVLTSQELKSYARAGAVAEEVLTAIRTVFAYNGAHREHKRYEKRLDDAKSYGIKKGFINGGMMGLLFLVINSAYALGFWYGWTLTEELDPVTGQPNFTVGEILLVFFNIIIGVFSLGNAGPLIGTIASARAAAFEIFNVIDHVPSIDTLATESGAKPDHLVGNIEFENVSFCYPARKEAKILNGISFTIKTGQKVALVGDSGCGKSTCVQLIQRFYDPESGQVKLDNQNLKDLNLKWLREQIGVVNQEPVLFGISIKDNILMGNESASDEELVAAAKSANAHDFIMKLPDKYDTLVGDRGSQLSGGQKQRIAIARAIVKNPKILLLDEATSALDNESEAIVQAALDRVSQGRTTIIVAHRLSTILNADIILAFKNGQVVESGTHAELMELKGVYYNQVIKQQLGITSKKDKKRVIEREAETTGGRLTENIHADVQAGVDEKEPETDGKKKKKKSKKDKKKDKEKEKKPEMKRVFLMNSPEWVYILVGCFASIISGAVQPAFSIILSKATAIFSECSYDERKSKIELYCILFVVIGVVTFISNIIQSGFFAFSGENLTKRIRSKAFQQMLTQEIGWFDKKENNVGTLCTKLSVEAAAVQGTTGVRLGFFLMNMGNFGVGLIISFVFSWAITLLILAFVPFMILSGILQTKMLTGFGGKDKEIIEASGKLTNEAIGNIRTVTSLGKQSYFTDRYSDMIYKPLKGAIKSAHINGIMLGFTTSILYYAIAAAYTFGAFLVQNNLFGMNLERIMLVFGCIMFGAQAVGQAASLMPDYAKAQAATVSIFELLDRKTSIDNWSDGSGEQTPPSLDQSNISLEAVEFTYPSRPNSKILNNLCLDIGHGQRVALVGSSGCGKSTIAQLLERFYDPDMGQVTLNGQDLRKISLYWLRSQIGIVSQEPILFDMSIAENIAYGDNSRQVTREEIIEAARKANIHDFIEKKLPKGYDTNVGSRGVQLSGGQKQRVAIARALIRNPKILILDEATSALDPTSEAVVQEALDRAQLGRTCIVIAHRLSTIRTADCIFVMQNGVVTEKGTHDELISLKDGFYAKLNGVL